MKNTDRKTRSKKTFDYDEIRKYVKENIPKSFFKPMIVDIIRHCNGELESGIDLIKGEFFTRPYEYYVYNDNTETIVVDAGLRYFFNTISAISEYNDFEIIPDVLIYYFCRDNFPERYMEFSDIYEEIVFEALKRMKKVGYGKAHHMCTTLLPYVNIYSDETKKDVLIRFDFGDYTSQRIKEAIVRYFTCFAEQIRMVKLIDEAEEAKIIEITNRIAKETKIMGINKLF